MSKSLQEKIREIRDQDPDQSDIDPADYENLILDEIQVERLTEADKKYLETFTTLEKFSLNQTHLKSLENMPDNKTITRIELSDNHLIGSELKHLSVYADRLVSLKVANNKIDNFDDLNVLKNFKALENLDLEGNPISQKDGYSEKVWALFPSLKVLDNHDQEGLSVFSDEEDDYDDEDIDNDDLPPLIDEDYGDEGAFEGGEDDLDDDYDDESDAAAGGANKRAKN